MVVQENRQPIANMEAGGEAFRNGPFSTEMGGRLEGEQRQARCGQIAGENRFFRHHAGKGGLDARMGQQRLGLGQAGLGITKAVLGIALRVRCIHALGDEGAFAVGGTRRLGELGLGLADPRLGFRNREGDEQIALVDLLTEAPGQGRDGAGELGRDHGTLGGTHRGRHFNDRGQGLLRHHDDPQRHRGGCGRGRAGFGGSAAREKQHRDQELERKAHGRIRNDRPSGSHPGHRPSRACAGSGMADRTR